MDIGADSRYRLGSGWARLIRPSRKPPSVARTTSALTAIEGERKTRAVLVDKRNREAVLWQP